MELIKDKNILFTKYLENKCTQEEKHLLYEMLSISDNERAFKEVLFSQINDIHEDQYENNSVDFERIYNDLLIEIKRRDIKESDKEQFANRRNLKRLVFEVVSVAAVFCIAFFLGNLFYHHTNVTSPKTSTTSGYNEVKAPMGARSEIKLSDGTDVMLNAGSSIKYRGDYNTINRDLILDGEAYFKVTKNINLPFVVTAGNIKIKATGTEFNVKAYFEEGIIETTLVKGEVEISQNGNINKDHILVLEPNQKAIYASKSDQLTMEKIKEIEPLAIKPTKIIAEKLLVSPKTDVEQVTAWTKNKLIIRSENLESLCTKLQRKYDVNFIFKDEELKKQRFSGILIDETFQQVMDVIKLTAPIDYILDGKTVIMVLNKVQAEKYSKNPKKNKN